MTPDPIREAVERLEAALANTFGGNFECKDRSGIEIKSADLSAILSLVRGVMPRPIEEAPRHKDLFVYRDDAGWMMARHTCLTEYMTDAEVEQSELSEHDLHEDDWFAYSQDGVYRLSNDGLPTIFVDPDALPLPQEGPHG